MALTWKVGILLSSKCNPQMLLGDYIYPVFGISAPSRMLYYHFSRRLIKLVPDCIISSLCFIIISLVKYETYIFPVFMEFNLVHLS